MSGRWRWRSNSIWFFPPLLLGWPFRLFKPRHVPWFFARRAASLSFLLSVYGLHSYRLRRHLLPPAHPGLGASAGRADRISLLAASPPPSAGGAVRLCGYRRNRALGRRHLRLRRGLRPFPAAAAFVPCLGTASAPLFRPLSRPTPGWRELLSVEAAGRLRPDLLLALSLALAAAGDVDAIPDAAADHGRSLGGDPGVGPAPPPYPGSSSKRPSGGRWSPMRSPARPLAVAAAAIAGLALVGVALAASCAACRGAFYPR